jgi:hypothetical protein
VVKGEPLPIPIRQAPDDYRAFRQLVPVIFLLVVVIEAYCARPLGGFLRPSLPAAVRRCWHGCLLSHHGGSQCRIGCLCVHFGWRRHGGGGWHSGGGWSGGFGGGGGGFGGGGASGDVKMNLKRIFRHLAMTHWQVRRAFTPILRAIEAAIKRSEKLMLDKFALRWKVHCTVQHYCMVRRLESVQLRFSLLRVWDTEHNNGMLIYVLLADRAVEIVADRGIHAKVGAQEWVKICHSMEVAFGQGAIWRAWKQVYKRRHIALQSISLQITVACWKNYQISL